MTDSDDIPPAEPDEGFLTPIVELAQDSLHLVQQELRLARQETIEKLTPAAQSTGMIVAGGLLAVVGSTYVNDAIVRLLATRMPHWLASLSYGTGLIVGGVALVQRGTNDFKHLSLVPEKTLSSLREDKAWLIRQIKSRLK